MSVYKYVNYSDCISIIRLSPEAHTLHSRADDATPIVV